MTKQQLMLFIGPPGAGKGSLSQLCIEDLGWKQLSTGQLCRKHIKEQTEIGKQINFSIKSGILISDSLITNMVEEWLSEPSQQEVPIILDGFPRNRAQAAALQEIVDKKLTFFSIEIYKFFVPDTIVIKRLVGRFICENKDCQMIYSEGNGGLSAKIPGICNSCKSELARRSDDEAQTIVNRISTYRAHEKDLLDFYVDKGLRVHEINVEKSLDIVFKSFKQLVAGSTI